MLYRVVLTFESVDEILKCDHSDENHRELLSCGDGYILISYLKKTQTCYFLFLVLDRGGFRIQ